ncbi:ATP-binding protein, partial [Klebsiella pneumoniae]|uniref:ATP-binding protein n=1 Tax=Klebsiella pneumoniae TaxID=573 RepID=UPI000ADF37B8
IPALTCRGSPYSTIIFDIQTDPIVVDDLGYVKRDNAETGVLFELIAHRYERGSLVITSNHPFSTWGSIFVDETMAVAAADRLIHHGYMFELNGESYRKKTAKAVTSAA